MVKEVLETEVCEEDIDDAEVDPDELFDDLSSMRDE